MVWGNQYCRVVAAQLPLLFAVEQQKAICMNTYKRAERRRRGGVCIWSAVLRLSVFCCPSTFFSCAFCLNNSASLPLCFTHLLCFSASHLSNFSSLSSFFMHPHPSPFLLFHFSDSRSFLLLSALWTFSYFSNYQVAVLRLLTECIHLAGIPSPSVTGICNYLSGSVQRENNAGESVLWIPTHILTFGCALKSDCAVLLRFPAALVRLCRAAGAALHIHPYICGCVILPSVSSRRGAALGVVVEESSSMY